MSEEETTTKDLIGDEEAMALNKIIASVTGEYFRALALLSDEEIFTLMVESSEASSNPRMIEIANEAYSKMLAAGGDLPRGHFNHYKQIVTSFNNTLVLNIDSKLESNSDIIIAVATGKIKNPERISHNDIIKAAEKE